MCGRYALGVRMNFVRRRLQEQGMPVDESPEDDEIRETYNFAPGNIGVVYRADTPIGNHDNTEHRAGEEQELTDPQGAHGPEPSDSTPKDIQYKLQGMKWGLVPFWTKRQPDYGSLMRTINCRDDSLAEDRGMWTSMKKKKRCVVVCQGYYEWEKRGKDKIPHYTKRKDGDLMYFAGLWDCVSYEGSDEKLYTFTVITTSARPSLSWLHDRMPVILEPKSDAWNAWLDPKRTSWSKDLQAALNPYEGDLECYQVPKDVGKVGKNSPDFIVPVDSKENKSNIANFFANAKKKTEPIKVEGEEVAAKKENDEEQPVAGIKREHSDGTEDATTEDTKKQKTQASPPASPAKPSPQSSAAKQKQMRSATHNQKPLKKPEPKKASDGTPRITNFFSK
ncbi:SOS response-associated peptidase [Aspergillus stella-maris]|uniref:SOS response-associated peptidase n=1 Tax=Aspergillus stella-maris TaxID=1810926 RepID=UPI003CCE4FF7